MILKIELYVITMYLLLVACIICVEITAAKTGQLINENRFIVERFQNSNFGRFSAKLTPTGFLTNNNFVNLPLTSANFL
jgi:hypothetical protein